MFLTGGMEVRYLPAYKAQAQNLRQSLVVKTSFDTRVSRTGLGSFVDIIIFFMKYYFIQFLHILHFFQIS